LSFPDCIIAWQKAHGRHDLPWQRTRDPSVAPYGIWLSENRTVGLAHCRLSILDLSPLGRNPMQWDDGRLQITYNGEIYNFQELRDQLKTYGYRFRSNTDTEVILAAYDRWGVGCLQRFIGMFAFGIWDARENQLFLARPRLEKKADNGTSCKANRGIS
jgi:asparagine synthase (glutamine-hydrolysing)